MYDWVGGFSPMSCAAERSMTSRSEVPSDKNPKFEGARDRLAWLVDKC